MLEEFSCYGHPLLQEAVVLLGGTVGLCDWRSLERSHGNLHMMCEAVPCSLIRWTPLAITPDTGITLWSLDHVTVWVSVPSSHLFERWNRVALQQPQRLHSDTYSHSHFSHPLSTNASQSCWSTERYGCCTAVIDGTSLWSEFFWNISESVFFELFRVTLCAAGLDSVFVQHGLIVLFVVLRVIGWRRSVIQTMVITSLRSHRRQWIHALCIKIVCVFTYRSGGSRSNAV